jgi:hypothetical protein
MNRTLVIGALVALLIGMIGIAHAAPEGQAPRDGGPRQGQRGEGRGRGHHKPGKLMRSLVHGRLLSIDGDTWTIEPQLPPRMEERREKLAERGHELPPLPELPDSVTVNVAGAKFFYGEGEQGSAGDFKVGDMVVVRLDKPWDEGGSNAVMASDAKSARARLDKLQDQRGNRGRVRGRGPAGNEQ